MAHQSELIATDIEGYLQQQQDKELLRLLTCGSVDDGKSTLIGRLLYDAKMIYEDQLAAIERDSKTHGTTGGEFDPALLTDGLKAEREQGITIDVAYRYFSTARRKFIIADTPGHEQYTRNMATGASNCDLAVILVDARHGVVTQTRRHSFIVSLLGIRHVIVAVNKMDLVDYSQEVFERIQSQYMAFAARMELDDIRFIPISALKGANVVDRSEQMSWYQGSTLMHMLENVAIASDRNLIDFRMPVQYVNRPHLNFRGYCGTVASGVVRPGDKVMVLPSKRTTRVQSIITHEGELEEAFAPHAVTLTFEDEVDVSRGDMIVHPGNVPRVSATLDAMVVWMSDAPLQQGKRYLFKHCTQTISGAVHSLRYQIDVNSLQRVPAESATELLALNEIGRCSIRLSEAIACDDYASNRTTGSFIVIDALSNATVGAGMILDRTSDQDESEHWDTAPAGELLRASASHISNVERAERFAQTAMTVLLTGLSGSGKTSLALALERRLFDAGHAVAVLDGEQLRLGLNRDLGFSETARAESLRRSAELAATINDSGLICICALTAPEQNARERMVEIVGQKRFLTVHLDVPVEVCRERDESGFYARADSGEIEQVPGVSFPYQVPPKADLVLSPEVQGIAENVDRLMRLLRERGAIA